MFLVCVFVVVVILHANIFFFFQAEDGIRDLVRSRGLGDVYKRQGKESGTTSMPSATDCSNDVSWRFSARSVWPVSEDLSLIHI